MRAFAASVGAGLATGVLIVVTGSLTWLWAWIAFFFGHAIFTLWHRN